MTKRIKTAAAGATIAVLAVVLLTAAFAQQPAQPKWAASDVLPLTCAQAWEKSGRSYPEMLSIVRTLARISLANRDLTFPNTRQAGLEAGKGVVEGCKADPNGLLFSIVDKEVRRVAEPAGSPRK